MPWKQESLESKGKFIGGIVESLARGIFGKGDSSDKETSVTSPSRTGDDSATIYIIVGVVALVVIVLMIMMINGNKKR